METGSQYVNRLFSETESLLTKVGILSLVVARSGTDTGVEEELEDTRADLKDTLGKVFAQMYEDFTREWETTRPSDKRMTTVDSALYALVDYLYES